jgi:hypothetical protein
MVSLGLLSGIHELRHAGEHGFHILGEFQPKFLQGRDVPATVQGPLCGSEDDAASERLPSCRP